MDYTEFVDTLWTTAATHHDREDIRLAKEEQEEGGSDKREYEIHGHTLDGEREKETQKEEEVAWKTEQEQLLIRDDLILLNAKVEQTNGRVKDAWTIIDYNRALDLLSRGRAVDVLSDEDKYHTNVAPVARKVMRAITEYEEAEAERRAAAIMQGHTDKAAAMGQRRDMCRRKLRGAQQMLNDVKVNIFPLLFK
jgi:hypothetical protein